MIMVKKMFLQRLREQIKTWATSSDVKDKEILRDNRKLIELVCIVKI